MRVKFSAPEESEAGLTDTSTKPVSTPHPVKETPSVYTLRQPLWFAPNTPQHLAEMYLWVWIICVPVLLGCAFFVWRASRHNAPSVVFATTPHATVGIEHLRELAQEARAALKARNSVKAETLARQLLEENTDTSSMLYGEYMFEAHNILGAANLQDGNVEAAKMHLLESGKTPGSPLLDSFGPDTTLAQQLLARGEKQAVLDFLDEVAVFWATPRKNADAKSLEFARGKAEIIATWKRKIQRGQPTQLNKGFPED